MKLLAQLLIISIFTSESQSGHLSPAAIEGSKENDGSEITQRAQDLVHNNGSSLPKQLESNGEILMENFYLERSESENSKSNGLKGDNLNSSTKIVSEDKENSPHKNTLVQSDLVRIILKESVNSTDKQKLRESGGYPSEERNDFELLPESKLKDLSDYLPTNAENSTLVKHFSSDGRNFVNNSLKVDTLSSLGVHQTAKEKQVSVEKGKKNLRESFPAHLTLIDIVSKDNKISEKIPIESGEYTRNDVKNKYKISPSVLNILEGLHNSSSVSGTGTNNVLLNKQEADSRKVLNMYEIESKSLNNHEISQDSNRTEGALVDIVLKESKNLKEKLEAQSINSAYKSSTISEEISLNSRDRKDKKQKGVPLSAEEINSYSNVVLNNKPISSNENIGANASEKVLKAEGLKVSLMKSLNQSEQTDSSLPNFNLTEAKLVTRPKVYLEGPLKDPSLNDGAFSDLSDKEKSETLLLTTSDFRPNLPHNSQVTPNTTVKENGLQETYFNETEGILEPVQDSESHLKLGASLTSNDLRAEENLNSELTIPTAKEISSSSHKSPDMENVLSSVETLPAPGDKLKETFVVQAKAFNKTHNAEEDSKGLESGGNEYIQMKAADLLVKSSTEQQKPSNFIKTEYSFKEESIKAVEQSNKTMKEEPESNMKTPQECGNLEDINNKDIPKLTDSFEKPLKLDLTETIFEESSLNKLFTSKEQNEKLKLTSNDPLANEHKLTPDSSDIFKDTQHSSAEIYKTKEIIKSEKFENIAETENGSNLNLSDSMSTGILTPVLTYQLTLNTSETETFEETQTYNKLNTEEDIKTIHSTNLKQEQMDKNSKDSLQKPSAGDNYLSPDPLDKLEESQNTYNIEKISSLNYKHAGSQETPDAKKISPENGSSSEEHVHEEYPSPPPLIYLEDYAVKQMNFILDHLLLETQELITKILQATLNSVYPRDRLKSYAEGVNRVLHPPLQSDYSEESFEKSKTLQDELYDQIVLKLNFLKSKPSKYLQKQIPPEWLNEFLDKRAEMVIWLDKAAEQMHQEFNDFITEESDPIKYQYFNETFDDISRATEIHHKLAFLADLVKIVKNKKQISFTDLYMQT